MDVTVLATTVVSQLLVPVLKAGWDRAFDAAAEQAGEQVAEETRGLVRRVWDRLREALGGDPQQDAVLATFEQRPEAAAPLLEDLLSERLAADPGLARELEELVHRRPDGRREAAQVVGETVVQVFAEGASVHHHGVIAGVMHGSVGFPAAPRRSPEAGDRLPR